MRYCPLRLPFPIPPFSLASVSVQAPHTHPFSSSEAEAREKLRIYMDTFQEVFVAAAAFSRRAVLCVSIYSSPLLVAFPNSVFAPFLHTTACVMRPTVLTREKGVLTRSEQYAEWAQATDGPPLDALYGDCTEMLLDLFGVVERETSSQRRGSGEGASSQKTKTARTKDGLKLANQALQVAEIILRDKKYRSAVEASPNLIHVILDGLEQLGTADGKRAALAVLSSVGSTAENRLEIGRSQGFRRILRWLEAESDAQMAAEILTALRRFGVFLPSCSHGRC